MFNKCPDCGEELPRIWTDHVCKRPSVQEPQQPKDSPSKQKPEGAATEGAYYQGRDPEKHRAYMREYMRKRRSKS